MLSSERYYLLDKEGSCSEPTSQEVSSLADSGIVTAFVLDANVCLDILKFAKNMCKGNPRTRSKVEHLLVSANQSKADIIPGLGLCELSSDRLTLSIDKRKYESLGREVAKIINLPIEKVFDESAIHSQVDIVSPADDIEPFMPLLTVFYCNLLKIKLMVDSGDLSARSAYFNLAAFVEWTDKMGLFTPLPAQVALAIFGGDSESRKMLNVRKGKSVLQTVWGAAWDMFYAFFVQQYAAMVHLEGNLHRAILATNDRACHIIASRCSTRVAVKDEEAVLTSVIEFDFNYPHLRPIKTRLDVLFNNLRSRQLERSSLWSSSPDLDLWIAEKEELEKKLL